MKFSELKELKQEIIDSLNEMNFFEMTQIQEKSIPFALSKIDIIGQAQTGTGKTASFGIPIINSIDENSKAFEHLIVAPTRELATQIFQELKKIGRKLDIKIVLILGGVSYEKQGKELNSKPHIIVATPGRLNDYLLNKRIKLNDLKTFTLDEADELLNIGFQKEIESIISFLPKDRQNFFFTATFNEKTKKLANKIVREDAKNISVSTGLKTTETIKQQYIVVKEKNKWTTLIKLLEFYKPKSTIIFGRTKRRVDELNEALNSVGFQSIAIQGDMQQRDRQQVIDKFKNQKKSILVATDVMARGIDVSHVEWIINFDLPQEIEYYTHRIGRAGRAGRVGNSISFVKPDEIEHMKEIEIKTNSSIKELTLPSDEEIYNVWRNSVELELKEILNKQLDNENNVSYLEDELSNNFNQKELAILLAHFLLKTKKNKKILLSPEPSVILKGAAKVRSIKKHINNFNKPKKQQRSKRMNNGKKNN